MTLKNSSALYILAALTLLLTFTQSRSWAIIQYFVFMWKRPVSLESDGRSDPLERLSQGEAIIDMLPIVAHQLSPIWKKSQFYVGIRKMPLTEELNSDCPVISPLFGIMAVFNLAVFVVLGVVIPWFVSEGALGAPLVRSKWGAHCLNVDDPYLGPVPGVSEFAILSKTDATFQLCQNRLDEGCQNRFFIQQPQSIKTKKLHILRRYLVIKRQNHS